MGRQAIPHHNVQPQEKHTMATENPTLDVKNFLGHPCKVAPLLLQQEGLNEFRLLQDADSRFLVQLVGTRLADLNERTISSMESMQLLHRLARDPSSEESLDSLIALAADYSAGTADLVSKLTTCVLAILQQADLVAASQVPIEPAEAL
jgi:hypothetical protein